MTQNNLGTSLSCLALLSEGAVRLQLLHEAVAAYSLHVDLPIREHAPADWAMTQNNLGNALSNQALLAEGAERLQLLQEAVAAYRAALQVHTREHEPAD